MCSILNKNKSPSWWRLCPSVDCGFHPHAIHMPSTHAAGCLRLERHPFCDQSHKWLTIKWITQGLRWLLRNCVVVSGSKSPSIKISINCAFSQWLVAPVNASVRNSGELMLAEAAIIWICERVKSLHYTSVLFAYFGLFKILVIHIFDICGKINFWVTLRLN